MPSSVADTGDRMSTGVTHASRFVDELLHVLTLQDYNTNVVVVGVSALGLACGLIGSFLLLRKRALLGDAISHAMLPGIAGAFMVMSALGGSGKSLVGLLIGAAISGAAGLACILLIRHFSRIKEDAALGIILSVFFGLGVVLLTLIQQMRTASAAGLESFIYGKTASMLASDAIAILIAAVVISIACLVLFKEFTVLSFDQAYAQSQGFPVHGLDIVMTALVIAVMVIGLQAVGLILMIAMLVIPPAAARFWTDRLHRMLFCAGAIGLLSGLFGALISTLTPRMPAGAVIVLVAGAIFFVSMVFGTARGVVRRVVEHVGLARKVALQHLLRAMYELREAQADCEVTPTVLQEGRFSADALQPRRAWNGGELQQAIRLARRAGYLTPDSRGGVRLTESGANAAIHVVRNHRLWEIFLITHADIAPSHVDRDADMVEHVLDPAMIAELEAVLAKTDPALATLASPHHLPSAGGAG